MLLSVPRDVEIARPIDGTGNPIADNQRSRSPGVVFGGSQPRQTGTRAPDRHVGTCC